MVFPMCDECQCVHERHGPVIIIEMNYFLQRLSMFGKLPIFELLQMALALFRRKQVFRAFQGFTGLLLE